MFGPSLMSSPFVTSSSSLPFSSRSAEDFRVPHQTPSTRRVHSTAHELFEAPSPLYTGRNSRCAPLAASNGDEVRSGHSTASSELRRVTALLSRYKEYVEQRLLRHVASLEAELTSQRTLCDRLRRDNALLLAELDRRDRKDQRAEPTAGLSSAGTEAAALRDAVQRRDAEVRQLRLLLSAAQSSLNSEAPHRCCRGGEEKEKGAEKEKEKEKGEEGREAQGLRAAAAEPPEWQTVPNEIAAVLRDAAEFAEASADAAEGEGHSAAALRRAAQHCRDLIGQKGPTDRSAPLAAELRVALGATHGAAAAVLRDALRALRDTRAECARERRESARRLHEVEEEAQCAQRSAAQSPQRDAAAQTALIVFANDSSNANGYDNANDISILYREGLDSRGPLTLEALERDNAAQAVRIAQLQQQRERFLGAVDADLSACHPTRAALSGTFSEYLLE